MDINNKKFYEAETMGGTGGNWYKEYTEARKEITRLNEKLAALQPSPLPLISAEEILKSKIDRHKWGYNFSNIQGTEGTMNDFLNIALDAMREYADLKAPKSVPLIDKGEAAVDFLLWMTGDMFINRNDESPKDQAQIHYNNFKNKKQ